MTCVFSSNNELASLTPDIDNARCLWLFPLRDFVDRGEPDRARDGERAGGEVLIELARERERAGAGMVAEGESCACGDVMPGFTMARPEAAMAPARPVAEGFGALLQPEPCRFFFVAVVIMEAASELSLGEADKLLLERCRGSDAGGNSLVGDSEIGVNAGSVKSLEWEVPICAGVVADREWCEAGVASGLDMMVV